MMINILYFLNSSSTTYMMICGSVIVIISRDAYNIFISPLCPWCSAMLLRTNLLNKYKWYIIIWNEMIDDC